MVNCGRNDHIIRDGDLIRVAVPPIDEDMAESTWIRVQDTYDAGRLVGFPPGSSDEEYRDLTPRSSVTGLQSSSHSVASDWESETHHIAGPDALPQCSPGAALGNMGSAAGFAQHPIVDTALHPGVFQRPQSQQQHAQEGKYRLCLADHLPPETTASQEHVALPITPQQLSSFLELGSRLILDSSRTSTQRLRSQSPRSKHYVDKRYMPMLESCTFSRMGPMTPARDGWHGVS